MPIEMPEIKSEAYWTYEDFVRINKELGPGAGAVDAHENTPQIVKDQFKKGEEMLFNYIMFLTNF